MVQKWYLEVYKPAETVSRTKEIRMLNYASEILFALTLVLFSSLSYWLVRTLNGLVKFPESQSGLKRGKSGEMKQNQGDWVIVLRSVLRQNHLHSPVSQPLKNVENA
jgi:hypothetical protein